MAEMLPKVRKYDYEQDREKQKTLEEILFDDEYEPKLGHLKKRP